MHLQFGTPIANVTKKGFKECKEQLHGFVTVIMATLQVLAVC